MKAEKERILKELFLEETKKLWASDRNPLMKDPSLSSTLRKQGNDLYFKVTSDQLKREEVYKLYTRSIALAEPNSENLALAYGNRSALLFLMDKYNECLSDIDRSLKIKVSDSYRIKLLCRKIECLTFQGLPGSKHLFTEAEGLITHIDPDDKDYKAIIKLMEKAKLSLKHHSKNDQIKKDDVIPKHIKVLLQKEKENPFSSVSIAEDKKYGRYLTANKDFEAGEITFVEKPYLKVVNFKNGYLYCSHCLTISWAMIPCDHCSKYMFCSEQCKNEAWKKYHDVECIVVSHALSNSSYDGPSTSHHQQLLIKGLILGIREAGSLQDLRSNIHSLNKKKGVASRGFQENGPFKESNFQTLYTLCDNVSNEVLDLYKYTANSVSILLFILKYTPLLKIDYSKDFDKLIRHEDTLFIGALMLKLLKISKQNAQQLSGENPTECRNLNDDISCHSQSCCNRGYGIIPINSLINHNCDPNVKNVVTASQKIINYTLVPIKKGSQLFITYHKNFYDMSRYDRAAALNCGFNFKCDCLACRENWPTLQELLRMAQENPDVFQLMSSRKEIELLNIENELVRSLLENPKDSKPNQKMIHTLSRALGTACRHVRQPSIVLWKLKSSVQRVFEMLYVKC